MSISPRFKNAVVTVYAGTPATAADGNRYLTAPWTAEQTGIRIGIQEPDAKRVQTVFGSEYVVNAVGFSDPDLIAEERRILVTGGHCEGERFAVAGRRRHRGRWSRLNHDELALVATDEVFP